MADELDLMMYNKDKQFLEAFVDDEADAFEYFH